MISKILHSKIESPKRHQTIHRNRLLKMFTAFRQKKLTTVIAGAGYGKTTLLSDAVSRMDVHGFWYRLDNQDTDFQVFASYLHACFNGSPPFCSTLQTPLEVLTGWLSSLEEKLTTPSVLIFDDFHLVQENKEIMTAVEFILDHLPPLLHLVIIGRREIPLRISRLRAQDLLLELDERALSFTREEISSFFQKMEDVTDRHIRTIASGTGGWAAGLVLVRYALQTRQKDALPETHQFLNPAPKYIFSYLKENVFDPQPAPVKAFMMKTSLLPEIDTELCRSVFQEEDAKAILEKMVTNHLMLFPVDDSGTRFSMHPLLKDFLTTQISLSFSQDEINRLHIDIAKALEPTDIFLALPHYIEARAYGDAIRLMEAHETIFLMYGKINFLKDCLSGLPLQVVEKNPKLLLTQAKLHSYLGDPRKAMQLITRSHLLFKKQHATEEMISCLVELGTQYYYTGHVKEAKLLMEQVLEEISPQSVATYAVAMTFLTFLSSVLGEFQRADAYYQEAMEVIDGYPELERQVSAAMLRLSVIHSLFFKGDFEGSYDASKTLLTRAMALNLDPYLPLIYYQLSADCFYLEAFEKGVAYARQGILACERISLSGSTKGWLYLAFAQNMMGQGRLDQAETLLDKSISLFEDPGNRWGIAHTWGCRHLVYLKQGAPSKAVKILNKALELIKGYGLGITEGMIENALAAILITEKKYDGALSLLSNARQKLKGAQYYLFNNHLLSAKALAGQGKHQKAASHLDHALNLSKSNEYSRFLKREKGWIVELINETAFSDTPVCNDHAAILTRLFETERNTPVLQISLLGSFKAVIQKETIFIPEFKSANALMILKYLAANRERGFIPKEELIELIWPEENPKKTGSRFNMAMSHLRKALEPDIPARSPSSYIDRKKDAYRLYPDERMVIDAERFCHAASAALKVPSDKPERQAMLLAAESIYQGGFLEENRYQEWCIEKNRRHAQLQAQLLTTISNDFEQKGDIQNAIFFTRKKLHLDPCDETAFKSLMHLYHLSGDLLKVTRAYQEYKQIVEQMDLWINPEITTLYEKLTQT